LNGTGFGNFLAHLVKYQVSLCRGVEDVVQRPVSTFILKVYYTSKAQQNVTKFGVKHHWGKGNQFGIHEGVGPPGARGAGPNKGNNGIYFKSSRTA